MQVLVQQLQDQQLGVYLWSQPQFGQSPLRLIQECEALPAEQQSSGFGPLRTAQIRQRRGHNSLSLMPIMESTFRREELEGGPGQLPGLLGGYRLIPEPLGLTPQAAHRGRMAGSRLSLTAQLVQLLLGGLGLIQGR